MKTNIFPILFIFALFSLITVGCGGGGGGSSSAGGGISSAPSQLVSVSGLSDLKLNTSYQIVKDHSNLRFHSDFDPLGDVSVDTERPVYKTTVNDAEGNCVDWYMWAEKDGGYRISKENDLGEWYLEKANTAFANDPKKIATLGNSWKKATTSASEAEQGIGTINESDVVIDDFVTPVPVDTSIVSCVSYNKSSDPTKISFEWPQYTGKGGAVEYKIGVYNLTLRNYEGVKAREFVTLKDSFEKLENSLGAVQSVGGTFAEIAYTTDGGTLLPGHQYFVAVIAYENQVLATSYLAAGEVTAAGNKLEFNITKDAEGETDYVIANLIAEWDQAASISEGQGGSGKIVEINDQEEQTVVESLIASSTGSRFANLDTIVSDGGSVNYLWIGATDKDGEGLWVWDGNNDGNSTPLGTGQGAGGLRGAVSNWLSNEIYENWGRGSANDTITVNTQNEPDNYYDFRIPVYGQNYAAIALENWPSGFAQGKGLGDRYQWNDIAGSLQTGANTIGFIMEFGE